MNSIKGLSLITVAALTATAFAADGTNTGLAPVSSQQNQTSSSQELTTVRPSQRWSLIQNDRSICYTIRSYKVKRTEHLSDRQTGVRGYSTCEMATDYTLRSAEWQAHAPDKK